jgi:hypothetical protein
VRQHDAGAADADAFGERGYGGNQYLRRRADNSLVAVMLRDPKAVIAECLTVLRERDRVTDRVDVRAIYDGDRLVEDGKAQGAYS